MKRIYWIICTAFIAMSFNACYDGTGIAEADPYVKDVCVGGLYACALVSNGKVRCWGISPHGETGQGNQDNIGDDETPDTVDDLDFGDDIVITQISCGLEHVCGVTADHNMFCWGNGDNGRLGYGDTENVGDNEAPGSREYIPVGSDVEQVSAGGFHTCALLTDGNIRCWGLGDYGQLGNNDTDEVLTPNAGSNVPIGEAAIQISSGYKHSCAVTESGKVYCWGWNQFGQVGRGDFLTTAPVSYAYLNEPALQITTNNSNSCALLESGMVRCWGLAGGGQLGDGTTESNTNDPMVANTLNFSTAVSKISGESSHSCALLSDGTIRCWGQNNQGQLGHGDTNPIGDDETPENAIDLGGELAVSVAAGHHNTCVVLANNEVKCWGDGMGGQNGYANTDTIGDNETPSSIGYVSILPI